MLKEIGLGQDAEYAYRTLLKEPTAEVQVLAEQFGWSVDRVSTALAELSELSLVRPSWENRGSSRPVDPELGLKMLIQSQEMELLKLQQTLSESKLAVARLIADYRDEEDRFAPSTVKLASGPDAVQACIERVSHECHDEVEVFLPGGAQPAVSLQESRPLDLMLLERSVRVRCVYLDSIRNDRPTSEYAQWLGEQGGQVRTVPQLPLRMIIWDRRVALVPVDPLDQDRGAFLLSSPGPVAALQALFEQVWQMGSRFGEERERDRCRNSDGAPADQEAAVLGLLAAGLTDEVIARKLGVSVRTSRRITAELMSRLGARSRFQLGALAAQRGWLTV
ncbi:LuxR C-terminal-related transcriptional regulator [Streptomyces sp. NPDC001787]|uniref:LuxR C-terminal-related transcriptional regulator n=1 Tax=Streptomyces sp. NPDC001787 TaxID=3154523 RepID=UPI00331D91E2